MSFAPVAELPAFGVADFAVLFVLLGLLVLRFAWTHTFHVIFAALAVIFDISVGPFHPFGFLVRWLRGIDDRVYQGLGFWIGHTEHVWHKMLLWQGYILTKTGDEIANLTYDAGVALGILHKKVSPAAIAAISKPLFQHYTSTLPAVHVAIRPATIHAVATSPTLTARVGALEKEFADVKARAVAIPAPFPLHRGPGAISIPRQGAVVLPKPNTGELKKVDDNLGERITNLAKRFAPAAIVGLIGATVLKGLNLGWLKCSGVNRVGRALCRASSLLESLFLDAIEVLAISDICRFVGVLNRVAEQIQPELLALVDVEDALIGCHGATKPLPLKLPPLSLAPVANPLPLG